MADTAEEWRAQLSRWATAHVDPAATVRAVERLPGHSGITYAFDVAVDGRPAERLVIRVPPAGVRRSGITDVLRQVPLLQAVAAAGVPVPAVRWWGEDEAWFGVPYLVVSLVAGGTLGDVFEEPLRVAPADAPPLFAQAMEALARIHAVGPDALPSGWDVPRALGRHVDRWVHLLGRAPEPAWVPAGEALAASLRAGAPADRPPRLVHNDFYSNNWMFDAGRLTGVLDWEGAVLGDPAIDVGWACMMVDRASWAPDHRARIAPAPAPEDLAAAYAQAAGAPVAALDWYRAFAGLRLAALTAYYLDLHRRGRRADPVWETFARSVPFMLDRGAALLR